MKKYMTRRGMRLTAFVIANLWLVRPGIAQSPPAAHGTNSQPVEVEQTIVTGSLAPTSYNVGPAPVQTITAEDIQQSGAVDVLGALEKFNPAFSGNGNFSGPGNNNVTIFNGQAAGEGESFISLRNLPTLVLVDGRRVASSAMSAGQGVDVNLFPVNMIDRIEVLEDGASALYGSDAVGGVVNIITKKDFNGVEISQRIGFPTESPGTSLLQYKTSILAGYSSNDFRIVFGGQFYHMDPLRSDERPPDTIPELMADGLLPVNASTSVPGRLILSSPTSADPGGVGWILAGSPFAAGAAGYRPGLTTPPVVSGGPFTSIAAYNAAATTQLGYAPYINLSTTPLVHQYPALGAASTFPVFDLAQGGTYELLGQDRDNLNLNIDHDYFGKRIDLFGQFSYTHLQSYGALAADVLPGLESAGVTVPANNPYNPFGIALNGTSSPGPDLLTRFNQLGNRLVDTYSDDVRLVGGVKGTFGNGYDYEVAGTYNREDQTLDIHNIVSGPLLNQALTPSGAVNGQGQPLSTLRDANGNPVPVLDIFSVGNNSAATLGAISTTIDEDGFSDLTSVDAKVTGAPFELPAGRVTFATGASYIRESLSTSFSSLLTSGEAVGYTSAFGASGSRDRYAVFAEVNIPIFSPDNRIPGFYGLEVTAAGRFEDLNPGGDSGIPKIGLLWQPIDKQITLRGSYSESFVAPSIYNLFGPNTPTLDYLKLPDGTGQEEIIETANPNLKSTTSQQFNCGIVFSPNAIPGLTASVDYYHIQEQNVAVADYTAALNSLNTLGSASPYAPGYVFSSGAPLTSTKPNQVVNATFGSLTLPVTDSEAVRTDGLDMSLRYIRPVPGNWGFVTLTGNANWTDAYEVQSSPGQPFYRYEGQGTYGFGTAQGIIPNYTLNASISWDYKNFDYTIRAHFIPGEVIPGLLFPSVYSPGATQGSTVSGQAQRVADYYTLDMQMSYEFGKGHPLRTWYDGLRLTAGCDNITDVQAPLIAGGPEDYTDKNVYDVLGRFVYFEVSKKF
ncbi:MAG TPA: TonB-dependent receptor [Verrucomicrobiae bacterium]|nr:TonB-dependent receptor [Verrucomicrobiae bacterium]